MQTPYLIFFWLFFFLFYVGVQPINNVLQFQVDSKWTQSFTYMCIHSSPKLPSHITLSRTPSPCLFMFNPALCQSLTHLHRTQWTWATLEIPTQSFSGLRRNICSRKILFLVFLPANSSCDDSCLYHLLFPSSCLLVSSIATDQ